MKPIQNIKFFIVFLLATMLFACEDFIEVDLPQTQLTSGAVYQDDVTATAALSDIYASMRLNGVITGNQDGLSVLMGLYTDELTYYAGASSPLNSFYNHSVIAVNDYVLSLWSNSYSQIYACNALLEGVSSSNSITAETKDKLKGESLFIRALLHFYLVNLYGDIPYITTTNYQINAKASRLPKNVVYDKILIDLLSAKELLTYSYPVPDRSRVNKAVVQALMARVYLYQENWGMAELEASNIINTSLYGIESNLDLAFLKDNPSTIWQLHPGLAGANTEEGRFFIFTSGPPAIAALSNNLIDAFDPDDLRRQYWIKSVTDGSNTWYHSYKYKQNENTGDSQEYSIIFRLEEQYLIRAEARAHLGNLAGGKEDLNRIRNRAGLGDYTANSQEELLSAIIHERRVELFTELGHRWFDLKRTGRAANVLSVIKPAWQNRDLLLPIPESELILNDNLQPQNPGY